MAAEPTLLRRSAPCVLYLPDLRLEDYVPIEEMLEARIAEELEVGIADEQELPQDPLPTVFADLDETWPDRTGLLCWICDAQPDGPPMGSPHATRRLPGGLTQYMLDPGVCVCSAPCAVAWICANYHGEERNRRLTLFYGMYAVYARVRPTYIEPALPRTDRMEYGGRYAWADYRLENAKRDPTGRLDVGIERAAELRALPPRAGSAPKPARFIDYMNGRGFFD